MFSRYLKLNHPSEFRTLSQRGTPFCIPDKKGVFVPLCSYDHCLNVYKVWQVRHESKKELRNEWILNLPLNYKYFTWCRHCWDTASIFLRSTFCGLNTRGDGYDLTQKWRSKRKEVVKDRSPLCFPEKLIKLNRKIDCSWSCTNVYATHP